MNQIAMSTPQTEGQMQQWQALLDSAAEGIWGLDLEGNCTFVNRMAVSTLGFDSEELVGRNMHELVHHHYPDGRHFPREECPIYDVVRKSKPLRQVTDTMFRKNGSSFVVELSAQPVIVERNVVGVVVTFREVTELRQQQEDLRKAYELAERKNRRVGCGDRKHAARSGYLDPRLEDAIEPRGEDDEWGESSCRVDDAANCAGRGVVDRDGEGRGIDGYGVLLRRFFLNGRYLAAWP